MIWIINVVSLLHLLMKTAFILHPFGKYSHIKPSQILKKMIATSLKVIMSFPEMGPYEVLVLSVLPASHITAQQESRPVMWDLSQSRVIDGWAWRQTRKNEAKADKFHHSHHSLVNWRILVRCWHRQPKRSPSSTSFRFSSSINATDVLSKQRSFSNSNCIPSVALHYVRSWGQLMKLKWPILLYYPDFDVHVRLSICGLIQRCLTTDHPRVKEPQYSVYDSYTSCTFSS